MCTLHQQFNVALEVLGQYMYKHFLEVGMFRTVRTDKTRSGLAVLQSMGKLTTLTPSGFVIKETSEFSSDR